MTTKEKLIQSAIKLFSEKWFEWTSTTAISKDAWFSSAALFVHFKTKNDLLDYLYSSIKKEFFFAANKDIDMQGDILDIMKKNLFQWTQFYLKNYEKFIFIKRFMNSPHVSRITQQEIEQEMKPIFEILEFWKKQGKIIDRDNAMLFSLVTGTFYSLVEYLHKTQRKPRTQDIELLIKLVTV